MHLRDCVAAAILYGTAVASTHADEARLARYIQEALEHNPGIRASENAYQASLERITRSRALPDPMLGVTQFARSPETRVGPQNTMLSISQTLPWFGKLADQEGIAQKDADALDAARREQLAETVLLVKLAYYDLAYVDRATAIAREDEQLLRHYETLAQARYAQGVGLQQPVIKLQAEITRDLNRLRIFARQRVDAEAALNSLRDMPPETAIAPIELGVRPVVQIDLEAMYELAKQHRPEAAIASAHIDRSERAVQLAKRQVWPDLTLGASWIYVGARDDPGGQLNPPADNGKDIFSLSLALRLPLFRGKYDAGVREAASERSGARETYRDVVNTIESAVRTLGFHIDNLGEQLRLFENALTPQAEQSLRSSEAAYASGTLGVLELLDSERTLLEVRLGHARLEADYWKALAEMERALGTPLPEEVTP